MPLSIHPLPPELRIPFSDVLARPDVWRGDAIAVSRTPTLPSGFAALDAELPGGGWPRGQLTELLHAHAGVGELSMLMPALAQLSREGRRVVLVLPAGRVPGGLSGTHGQLHAPGWRAAGVAPESLLLVHPGNARDALWAAVESLRCPGVAATLLWPDAPAPGRQAVHPLSQQLRRLQSAAGEGGGCAFALRPLACARQSSPAPLRLMLMPDAGRLSVSVLKRRGRPLAGALSLAVARPLPLQAPTHALDRPDLIVPARRPAFAE